MSDLPRVLLCSFDVLPGPTGFSRRMTEYLKGLCNRFTVVVLSTKTQDVSHIERYHGSRLLRVPVGTGDLASRLQTFERAVRRQLESEEYAIAHFTDPFGGYVISELKGQYGYRIIYEAHGFPSKELKLAHPPLAGDRRLLAKVRRQELFCLMNADRILTGSNISRQFIQSLGVAQEQVRVVRAPVDLGPYTARPMGEPSGKPMRIAYLGSQISWQGLPTLLNAVKRALAQVELRLTLVGPPHPDLQPRLEELVATLELTGKVELHPPVGHDELYKVLAAADLGVVPLEDVERNRLQGGPLAKVSEYFAAGRPVVASGLPVCRELLPEGTALFFKPGDAEDLADCLIELAKKPELRVEMGRKARAEALRRLDASLIRAQLLGIYDELLGRGEHPGAPEPPAPTATGTPTRRVPARAAPDSGSGRDFTRTDPAILLPAGPGRPLDDGPRGQEQDTDPRGNRQDTAPWRLPPGAEAPGIGPDTDPEGYRLESDVPTSSIDLEKLRDVISQAPASRLPAPRWAMGGTPPTPPSQPEPRSAPTIDIPLPPLPPAAPLPPPATSPAPESRAAPAAPPAEVLPAAAPLPLSPAAPPPPTAMEAPPAPPALRAPPEASAPPPAPALAKAPPTGAPAPSPEQPSPDQPVELADDLVEPVEDEAASDEAEEIDPDEVLEAEGPSEELPPSRIDPWFAQLAHGYCPPEGLQFARHTPPTTFPGRDEVPERTRTGEVPAPSSPHKA